MTFFNEIQKTFSGQNKTSIFYRHCASENERARLILAHGLGEHSGRYDHVIKMIAGKGISVWALDHRGHGKSDGKRGHVDHFDQYIDDLQQMISIANTNKPKDMSLLLLGHSMGGLIVLNFVERYPNLVNGVIASSPGLAPAMKVPLIKGSIAKFLSNIFPGLMFDNELDSTALSHDKNVVKAYDSDPLVHRKISARWFTEFLSAMKTTIFSASKIKIPVLMQVAGSDKIIDAETSRAFFDSLVVEDKTLFFYDDMYHEVYNEQDHQRKQVLDDLSNWLDNH